MPAVHNNNNNSGKMGAELKREYSVYCEHLNAILKDYQEELKDYLPLQPENLLLNLRDGVVLGHIVHYFYPETIRLDQLCFGIDLDTMGCQGNQKAIFEVTGNVNRVLEAAKQAKELVVVNLGAHDIIEMKEDLVLGLLWQLIRGQLLGRVNLISHPELVRLLNDGESLAVLVSSRPEPLLLRWFNYHLQKSGYPSKVTAFSKDIADGEAYLRLIKAIAPEEVDFDLDAALAEPKESRAERIVKLANELECLPIIKPEDILAGQPRLNLAFAATLFNKHCGIHLPTEDELRRLYEEIAGLKKTVGSLEEELEITNRYKVTDIKNLEDERNALKERLETTEALHQAQVAEIEQEFTNFKIELAAQYRESIESALTTERRARDEETGALKASISDLRRKLLKSISKFVDDIGPEQLKGTQLEATYSNISDETSNADLIQIQTLLFQALLEQRNLLQLSNESLKEELAHKENIEAIMAEKIRKYSEDRISESNVRGSRRSSLTNFKEKTIPAIGRFFTCQGR